MIIWRCLVHYIYFTVYEDVVLIPVSNSNYLREVKNMITCLEHLAEYVILIISTLLIVTALLLLSAAVEELSFVLNYRQRIRDTFLSRASLLRKLDQGVKENFGRYFSSMTCLYVLSKNLAGKMFSLYHPDLLCLVKYDKKTILWSVKMSL